MSPFLHQLCRPSAYLEIPTSQGSLPEMLTPELKPPGIIFPRFYQPWKQFKLSWLKIPVDKLFDRWRLWNELWKEHLGQRHADQSATLPLETWLCAALQFQRMHTWNNPTICDLIRTQKMQQSKGLRHGFVLVLLSKHSHPVLFQMWWRFHCHMCSNSRSKDGQCLMSSVNAEVFEWNALK